MTVTTINCFLGCQDRDFSNSICTCTFAGWNYSGFALGGHLPYLPILWDLWALLLSSYAKETSNVLSFFSVWFFFLFLCLTLFGFGFQEGILRRLKQNKTKNCVAAVIASMSPSCFKSLSSILSMCTPFLPFLFSFSPSKHFWSN